MHSMNTCQEKCGLPRVCQRQWLAQSEWSKDAHSLRSLYGWGIILHREIWGFGHMSSRYIYTNITISKWYHADFWLSRGTTKTSKYLKKLLCTDKDLSINMDITKVMVFNTTQAWVTKSEPNFFLGEEKVEYTRSYTYLSVTFVTPRPPHGRMPGLDFLMDMLPLVLLKENVHIYNSIARS